MHARRWPVVVSVLLSVVPFWGCTEAPDSPGSVQEGNETWQETFLVGNGMVAQRVGCADSFVIYKVLFRRPGEEKVYSFDEVLQMERMGLVHDDDPFEEVRYRSVGAVAESVLVQEAGGVRCSWMLATEPIPAPGPQPCPCCSDGSCTSWGCIKSCFL